MIPTGIFPVEGNLDSENGIQCSGSGYVKFETGNPVLNVAGGVAGAATIAGILGLLFNARPAITWRA